MNDEIAVISGLMVYVCVSYCLRESVSACVYILLICLLCLHLQIYSCMCKCVHVCLLAAH